MRALKKGVRGPDVAQWQRFLSEKGFLGGSADGIFAEKTDAATRAFQEKHALVVDGIAGPKTLQCAQTLGFQTYRRLRDNEVTPALSVEAKRLLTLYWKEPFGSEYPFDLEGRSYIARVEQHFHPPGGPLKPWGYHAGISLLVAVSLGPDEPVHDD